MIEINTDLARQVALLAGLPDPSAQVTAMNQSRMAVMPTIKREPDPQDQDSAQPAPPPPPPPPVAPAPLATVCAEALDFYGPEGTLLAGLVKFRQVDP